MVGHLNSNREVVREMEQVILGRTGLKVSRMGLGCGGHSRLGLSFGKSDREASEIVRQAIDLGVNWIDTAESYATERAVGLGIRGIPREQVYISTKAGVHWEDHYSSRAELRTRVEACLERLDTEYIDLFNLHGVIFADYAYGRDELVPELQKLQQEGKIRFIGITEQFLNDTRHEMLQVGLKDDVWDVVMVGFSLLNPSARHSVFSITQAKNIGTQCMFAVRTALSRPAVLRELMQRLVAEGLVPASSFHPDSPLDFLSELGVAHSLQEAAYRYCLHEPGVDVVLSGTSNPEHLKANAKALSGPPLPSGALERLDAMFAKVDSISGN